MLLRPNNFFPFVFDIGFTPNINPFLLFGVIPLSEPRFAGLHLYHSSPLGLHLSSKATVDKAIKQAVFVLFSHKSTQFDSFIFPRKIGLR